MVYKVIGLMSGSSLDGLDIVYAHLQEKASTAKGPKTWEYTLVHTACNYYHDEWKQKMTAAPGLSALEYQLLHAEYGRYLGEQVQRFIGEFGLHYQVQLVASHGHTSFHLPERRMTAQLGDGAALAAVTGINVVSDLRSMDLALGGQGAPIVPIGELLLLPGFDFYLNLGGIANISRHGDQFVAFDVCPANRVLNSLVAETGQAYDAGGATAATGRVDTRLLEQLNALPYYSQPWPKSLANEFGTDTVVPMIGAAGLPTADALRTYVAHVVQQIAMAVRSFEVETPARLLATGGGAHNTFLVDRLRAELIGIGVEVVVPEAQLVDFKEALVMALIGVLRWREEKNVLASVTGASRDSIGGAVWIGQS
ncbi:MAG: anhydro-N-acetylmuramic acid kinase [Bacteroidetes bacterium]|nr:anhydro-N-acetylmuramic acid kinase [Bacteroidota bacterium]